MESEVISPLTLCRSIIDKGPTRAVSLDLLFINNCIKSPWNIALSLWFPRKKQLKDHNSYGSTAKNDIIYYQEFKFVLKIHSQLLLAKWSRCNFIARYIYFIFDRRIELSIVIYVTKVDNISGKKKKQCLHLCGTNVKWNVLRYTHIKPRYDNITLNPLVLLTGAQADWGLCYVIVSI